MYLQALLFLLKQKKKFLWFFVPVIYLREFRIKIPKLWLMNML
ncbi:hypothetical protein REIS_0411 [Rickettsia endosymbiont of Ixodes scapularis]|nr:hypothetical protein REIS_0411 [Rickettsia endosymbiont of Ixodes scapularis]